MLHPKEKIMHRLTLKLQEYEVQLMGVMSVFLEISRNCFIGKKQCHWTPSENSLNFTSDCCFWKNPQTAKIRKHNTIHWFFFFHPCLCRCWSIGRRTWLRGQGENPLARWKSPRQWFSLTSAWERHHNKDAWAAGSWTTGNLLPAASCPPPSLQFPCFLPDVQTHTSHSFCSWFWSCSCRSYGFQEVIHLGSFIAALMNSFILE